MSAEENAPPGIIPADLLQSAAADAGQAAPGASGVAAVDVAPVAATVDFAAEATDIIETVYAIASEGWPSLAKVYTPEARGRVARALAPVLRKYNVSLDRLGPEIGLAIALLPLVRPTIEAIHHDRNTQTPQARQAPDRSAGDPASARSDSAAAAEASPLGRFPGLDSKSEA